jgi:monoamine oxidase
MAAEIQSESFQKKYGSKIKLHLRTAVKYIDLSQTKGPGVEIGFKRVKDQKTERLFDGKPDVSRYQYVILAIPPSVWKDMTFLPRPWDPKIEIGVLGMDPAVKFFTDVKSRFWIKRGLAPYGGSSTLGQVWEGTDNQTQIALGKVSVPGRGLVEVKQGIVLSVFAGPILPGGRTPTPTDCVRELTNLYYDYLANRNKTLFSDWPNEPFIKTGYASPRIGEIFKIAEKLNQPFHNLLFFAGEHTRMDFFGYMEGALRSGERAAKKLMFHLCKADVKPAPSQLRAASAA